MEQNGRVENLKAELKNLLEIHALESRIGQLGNYIEELEEEINSIRNTLYQLTGDNNFNNDPEVRAKMYRKRLEALGA